MNRIPYVFVIVFFVVFTNCGTSTSVEEVEQSTEAPFEAIDSIKFSYLGQLFFSDINFTGDRFLFFDIQRKAVVILNRSGEIINQFIKEDGLADSYGFLYALPAFDPDGNVIIHSMKGLMLYAQDGEYIKKLMEPANAFGGVSMFRTGTTPKIIDHRNNRMALLRFTGEKIYDENKKPVYAETPLFEIIDLSKSLSNQQIKFPSKSIFTDGMIYWETDYWPLFTFLNNRIYVAAGMDPNLYIYTVDDDFNVLQEERILLPYENFIPWKGDDPETYAPGMAMSRGVTPTTLGIDVVDDYLVMEYYPGMSKKEYEELNLLYKEDRDKAMIYARQLNEKYKRKLLVFDPVKNQLIKSITLPNNLVQGFVQRNGEVWHLKSQSVNVEEDYFTIYNVNVN
jgi:hypothetical protein